MQAVSWEKEKGRKKKAFFTVLQVKFAILLLA